MWGIRTRFPHASWVAPLAGESGISSRDIGAIGIRQQYSVVEVAEEVAEHVLAVLNHGVFICGTRVSAAVDDSGHGAPRIRASP